MSFTKQAKTLSRHQISLTTALLQQTRYPKRNHVIFLLSAKAGLRAKEIASLTWDMITDAEGYLALLFISGTMRTKASLVASFLSTKN